MNILNRELLAGITPMAIDRYLNLSGWIFDSSFPNKKVRKYSHPQEPDLQIWVPIRESFSDYYFRISEIVCLLSEWYEKDASEILKELHSTYSDHLEFRIISRSAEAGKLPLYYASQCVKGIRDLIFHSACAVQKPLPKDRPNKNPEEMLRDFELAQTGIGSFIINVDAKVADENYDQSSIFPPVPTNTHQTVERIAKALEQVQEIVDGSQVTKIAADAYKTGLTANICRSLLELKSDKNGPLDIELETTIHYASAMTERIGIKKVSRFGAKHFEAVREIQQIYDDNTIVEDVDFHGTLRGMKLLNERELKEYSGKKSWVTIEPADFHIKSQIRLLLTEEQYLLFCDALNPPLEVRVSGVLDKSESMWTIYDVSKFEIISQKLEQERLFMETA